MMTLRAAAALAVFAAGCTPHPEVVSTATVSDAQPATTAPDAAPSEVMVLPAEVQTVEYLQVDGETVLEGTIVSESPIGCGKCTQKSYEVQPAEPAKAVWVHFENCGDGPSPADRGLEGLDVGGRYRFVVRVIASSNFGDAPFIVDATAVSPPSSRRP